MQQFTGDLRGSEAMKRKAMSLDPLAFIHPINLGQTMVSQGHLAEGLQYTQRGAVLGAAMGVTSMWGNVFMMQARARNPVEAQKVYDANCTTPDPAEVQRCRVLHVVLLGLNGHEADARRELAPLAADVHQGKPLVQVGGIKGYVGLAQLYLIALRDPHGAAPEIRASLDSVQWFGYDKLLNTAQGQKLPEEISTDPDWLSAWSDPRLKEWMDAYRANLARFRRGE
jgi:hypothetical protein